MRKQEDPKELDRLPPAPPPLWPDESACAIAARQQWWRELEHEAGICLR